MSSQSTLRQRHPLRSRPVLLTVGRLARLLAGFLLSFLLLQAPALAQIPDDEGAAAGYPPVPFSVDGFQTDLFTGTASAAIPIGVPPGTGGAAPKIVLRYNSGTVDNLGPHNQGQWTGLGWTLDVGGYILRDTKNTATTSDDTFKLVFGGVSYDLVPVGNNFYHTADETFWQLQYYPDDHWVLTTKDGTTHRFGSNPDGNSKAVTYAPSSPYTSQSNAVTYKYLLDQVTTTSGPSVQYTYWKQSGTTPQDSRTYTQAVYPDTITYTTDANRNPVGPARTVQFLRADRTDSPTPTTSLAFFEQYSLDTIEVRVNGNLVRKYVFGYNYSITTRGNTWTGACGGGSPCTPTTGDLTLASVTQYGSVGSTALPQLSFGYFGSHLQAAHNGIGGTVSYTYDRVYSVPLYLTFKAISSGSCVDNIVDLTVSIQNCTPPPQLLAYALQVQTPLQDQTTGPIYSVCKRLDPTGQHCWDWTISKNPDQLGTWSPQLLGYAFSNFNTAVPGTYPLYSTCFNAYSYACYDWGAAWVGYDPTGGYVPPQFFSYIYQARVDRSRVLTRTVSDGLTPSATTAFAYTGFSMNSDATEFRGHQSVTVTDPLGNCTKTSFHQDDAKKGRIHEIDTYASACSGSALTQVVNTWKPTDPSPPPTFAYLDHTNVSTCDGGTPCKQTSRAYQYDSYGNVTQVDSSGDGTAPRTEVTTYVPNLQNTYIVGLPSQRYTLDANGVVVAQTLYYYDGFTNHETAPTKGQMTARCRWLNGGVSPCELFGYDIYGNVTTTTSSEGYTTTTSYETTYHAFPATVTTPPTPSVQQGLITQYVYDARYGTVSTVTDPNGQPTTYTPDVFGRPASITNALQETRQISYVGFGTVGSQHVRIDLPGGLWTETYFDGLGRTITVKKKAADGKVSVTDTAYDARGLVSGRSLPHFDGVAPQWITYQYDALGRLTLTTHPDSSIEHRVYSNWTVTVTDRNAHARTTLKDAFGRTTQLTDPSQGVTWYSYDVLGHLVRVADPAGHLTTIVYDTLGRKVQMTEPNMGTWTYGYDLNGNLTSQTDAKGQTLRFGYDGLNRLTTKTYPGTPTGSPPTITSGTAAPLPGSTGVQATFTVTATGGTLDGTTAPSGYEARWAIFDGANWTLLKPWNSDLMFQWTPPNANPAYVIGVEVRCAGSLGDAVAAFTSLPYPVGGAAAPAPGISPPGITATPSSGSVGTLVTFSVTGSGGTPPYETRWDLYNGTTWTTVQPWEAIPGSTSTSSFKWTPTVGNITYTIRAYIRNAGSPGDTPSSSTDASYAVGGSTNAPPSIGSPTADTAANPPPAAGTTIVFTVTATGGSGSYESRWGTSTDGGNTWTILQDWAAGTHFAWTPTQPGQYRIGVQVRNAGDVPASFAYTDFAIGTAYSPPPTINSFTISPAGSQPVNTAITFTANVSGGTTSNYESHWAIYDGRNWTVVRPWASGTTFTWTPTVGYSAYQVGVEVRVVGSLLAAFAATSPFAITGGASGTTVTYTYDTGQYGKGRRSGMTDLAGSESHAYDQLGRQTTMTRTTDGYVYTTGVAYKPSSRGLIDTLTYPDGEAVHYTYDDGGQVASVSGATSYVSGVTYEADGQIYEIVYGNGVKTTRTYEATTRRLQTLVTTGAGAQDFQYGYDFVGNVTAITDNRDQTKSQSFTYDGQDRLKTATYTSTSAQTQYTYDPLGLGNLASKGPVTYTYNTYGTTYETCGRVMPHAVIATSDGKRYSYDCNGNLVTDGDRTITWDADNRPLVIQGGTGTTTFAYSGDGARVKKQGPNGTIRYAGSYEDHAGVVVKHIFL